MIQERRCSKRLSLSKPIRYHQKGSQVYTNSLGKDISDKGIGFISDRFLPISSHVVIETHHPLNQDFIKVVAEVVWITSQPYSERFSVGARFLGPPIAL